MERLFPKTRTGILAACAGSLLVLLLCVQFLQPLLTQGLQTYSDIISSDLTFGDGYKSGDISFAILTTIFTLLSFLIIVRIPMREFWGSGELSFPSSERLGLLIQHFLLLYFSFSALAAFWSFAVGPFSPTFASQFLVAVSSLVLALISPGYPKIQMIAQLLLPFLLLRFLHLEAITENGIVRSVPALSLQVLIWGIFVCFLWKTWRKRNSLEQLLPFQAALISAFFSFHIPDNSVLRLDSYHFGEMLTPYQQVFGMGLSYYREFVSVHGLLAVFHGLIHRCFFDGTFASVPYAFAITDSLFAALLSGSLFLALPARAGLLLSFFILPSWNRFYLFPLVLALLSSGRTRSRPALWILLATFLGIFSLLFNHAPGFGIALCLAPFIVWEFVELPSRKQQWLVFSLAVLLIAVFAWPLWGAFSFIRDNGSGTHVAFGLKIGNPHEAPLVLKNLGLSASLLQLFGSLFKGFKLYGWLVGCVFLLAAFSWRGKLEKVEVFLAGFSVLFFSSLIPYSFGRVGTAGLDRVGALSILSLAFAVPFLVSFKRKEISTPLLALLLLCVGVRAFPYLKTFSAPLSLAASGGKMPSGIVWQPSAAGDPVNLGSPLASTEEMQKQRELGRLLDAELERGEGYYDFSDFQSHYFIQGRAAPYAYPSPLLAANQAVQARIIQRLELLPPKLVLIAPIVHYESSKPALRAYRIYRWLMEHGYTTLKQSDAGTFTILKRSANHGINSAREAEPLVEYFLDADLKLVPFAWGRNWEKMRSRFREGSATSAKIERNSAQLEFTTPRKGRDMDFLLIELKGAPGRVQLGFRDESGHFSSSFFNTGTSTEEPVRYLVPIGDDPRWLLSESLRSVSLSFENSPASVLITPLRLEN